ncbi:hypothetical protein P5495_021905 [Bacillus velezensis]|uniref:hypothetical protein n=1 Tax=Bacillus velezensis TaxID=492670 RepID=UPI002AFA8B5E|nr:hypothetical protein [Bacillus velezensis]MDH3104075.1 hypothetical protein [Bacillus velezensis]MDH3139021.1 hypothetical protein [Bacillus velezensis]HEO2443904.1 hypothetical protein [Streptococcus agalactiae]
MPTFQGFFEYLSGEIKWLFLIGFIIGLVIFCFKRSFIGAVIFLIGTIFIGMFVVQPEVMLTLPEKFAKMWRLGK